MNKLCFKVLLSVALLLTGQGMVSNGVKAQQPDPDFFIFLGIGQSNMQGKATIAKSDKKTDSNFTAEDWARYFKLIIVNEDASKIGTWETALPPIVRPDTKLGVTDHFGRYLVKGLDERYKIGVAVVAVDGCSNRAFSKDSLICDAYLKEAKNSNSTWVTEAAAQYGNYPYGTLVKMAKIARKSGVIKGIIYHQGETDAAQDGDAWLARVYELYTNLLTDLNLSIDSVPFIAGEPVQKNMGGVCYDAIPWVDKIPAYFKEKSGKDIAYVASSKDLTNMDQYHFSSDGYRKIGARYGEIMLPLLVAQGAVPSTVITVQETKEEDVIYDLLGRRLDAPQKGINIINGKKVIIR